MSVTIVNSNENTTNGHTDSNDNNISINGIFADTTAGNGFSANHLPDNGIEHTQGAFIEPTFLLRGLDIKELVYGYFDGKFNDIKPPDEKISRSSQQMTPDYAVGRDSNSQVYEFTDLTGKVQRVVTTNHDNYLVVKSKLNGQTCDEALNSGNTTLSELPKGGTCLWCRRKFEHTPVGIPTKSQYLPEKNITIFHVAETFCTYECSYSFLKSRISCSFNYRDYRFTNSEFMLVTMFEKTHPGELLKESPDWVLAQWNGGPLNDGDFFSDSHSYLKSSNIVMLPVKLEYLVSDS